MTSATRATEAAAPNVSEHLRRAAERRPDGDAVVAHDARRGWRALTWSELEARPTRASRALVACGVARGDRVALFVPPGADLIALVQALLRIGAVPVVLDPAIGAGAIAAALERVRPRVLLGVARAHALRWLYPRRLASIEVALAVGARWVPGAVSWRRALAAERGAHSEPAVPTRPEDTAAILFTSGSTGPAKGVVYTHGQFAAQIRALSALYGFEPGERDLACFPLFALFGPALELTSVFAPIDVTRPDRADPAALAQAIASQRCTTSFGSPAIWRRFAAWAAPRGERFPTLRRLTAAGAPVPPALVLALQELLPEGTVHTPYGATEALPVASIAAREIAGEVRRRTEAGHGTCVGRPAPEIEVALLPVTDEPVATWSEALRLPARAIGEVCVRGPVVTLAYAEDAAATERAKIASAAGTWHRMGDLGYLDEAGRLWFCGRKSERLETARGLVTTVPVENVVDAHPLVRRSALVGRGARGAERAVLVVEPEAGAAPGDALARALVEHYRARRADEALPAAAEIEAVRFRRSFPVDPRHNAKIRRDLLRAWVGERA